MSRERAREIVDRLTRLSAATHSRRRTTLFDRLVGRRAVEPGLLRIDTAFGQASLAMDPEGMLIVRSNGDPELARNLARTLPARGRTWDERQHGWIVARHAAVDMLTVLFSEPGLQGDLPLDLGDNHEAARPRKSGVVVVNTRSTTLTGEQNGNEIVMRITGALVQASLAAGVPVGSYEQRRGMGFWTFLADDLEAARAWAASRL